MEKGKTAKYVKYAIGEIVLVVIGILIALQINNWNQNRLKKLDELQLLETIKVDFLKAIETLELLNTRRDESLYTFNELLRLKSKQDLIDNKHIDSLLGKTLFTPTYNGKSGSLAVLLNTGKIDIISDNELREQLLSWPQNVEDMTEGEVDAKLLTNNQYNSLIRHYISFNDIIKHLDPTAQRLPFAQRESFIKKDYQQLFNNPEFENLITQLEFYYLIGKIETERLIDRANTIVTTIDNTLISDD